MTRFPGIATTALLVFAMDQLSKFWVVQRFAVGESLPLAPFFHLTHVRNTGTAFGLLQDHNHVFVWLAVGVIALFLCASRGLIGRGGAWAGLAVSLILGGAIGNVTDRLWRGQVIDFLDFRVWPVFNLADSAITLGTICLTLSLMRRREDRNHVPHSA